MHFFTTFVFIMIVVIRRGTLTRGVPVLLQCKML